MDNENDTDDIDLRKVIYLAELTKIVKRFNIKNRLITWVAPLIYPIFAIVMGYHWTFIVYFTIFIGAILFRIATVRKTNFQRALTEFIERNGLMNNGE